MRGGLPTLKLLAAAETLSDFCSIASRKGFREELDGLHQQDAREVQLDCTAVLRKALTRGVQLLVSSSVDRPNNQQRHGPGGISNSVLGQHIPPITWGVQESYQHLAALAVVLKTQGEHLRGSLVKLSWALDWKNTGLLDVIPDALHCTTAHAKQMRQQLEQQQAKQPQSGSRLQSAAQPLIDTLYLACALLEAWGECCAAVTAGPVYSAGVAHIVAQLSRAAGTAGHLLAASNAVTTVWGCDSILQRCCECKCQCSAAASSHVCVPVGRQQRVPLSLFQSAACAVACSLMVFCDKHGDQGPQDTISGAESATEPVVAAASLAAGSALGVLWEHDAGPAAAAAAWHAVLQLAMTCMALAQALLQEARSRGHGRASAAGTRPAALQKRGSTSSSASMQGLGQLSGSSGVPAQLSTLAVPPYHAGFLQDAGLGSFRLVDASDMNLSQDHLQCLLYVSYRAVIQALGVLNQRSTRQVVNNASCRHTDSSSDNTAARLPPSKGCAASSSGSSSSSDTHAAAPTTHNMQFIPHVPLLLAEVVAVVPSGAQAGVLEVVVGTLLESCQLVAASAASTHYALHVYRACTEVLLPAQQQMAGTASSPLAQGADLGASTTTDSVTGCLLWLSAKAALAVFASQATGGTTQAALNPTGMLQVDAVFSRLEVAMRFRWDDPQDPRAVDLACAAVHVFAAVLSQRPMPGSHAQPQGGMPGLTAADALLECVTNSDKSRLLFSLLLSCLKKLQQYSRGVDAATNMHLTVDGISAVQLSASLIPLAKGSRATAANTHGNAPAAAAAASHTWLLLTGRALYTTQVAMQAALSADSQGSDDAAPGDGKQQPQQPKKRLQPRQAGSSMPHLMSVLQECIAGLEDDVQQLDPVRKRDEVRVQGRKQLRVVQSRPLHAAYTQLVAAAAAASSDLSGFPAEASNTAPLAEHLAAAAQQGQAAELPGSSSDWNHTRAWQRLRDTGSGKQLAQALLSFSSLLCAALPTRLCCNEPSCCCLDKPSELQLASGKGSQCSGCGTARYCCGAAACQLKHWKQHKPACKAIAAAAAAKAGSEKDREKKQQRKGKKKEPQS